MTARTGPAVLVVSASAAHALAAAFSHGWVMGRAGWPQAWRWLAGPVNDSRPAAPHNRRSQTSLACSVSTLERTRPARSAANARNHRTGVRAAARLAASATLPAPLRRRCAATCRRVAGITRRPSASAA